MRLRLAHLLPTFAFLCATASEAATYYVRNGGSDSANGLSHGTAWATLDKVNSFSFAPGDQVLLYEGHRWVGALTVDWPGTSSAPAVVGAYYLDGSTPRRGYRTAAPIIVTSPQARNTPSADSSMPIPRGISRCAVASASTGTTAVPRPRGPSTTTCTR